MRTFDEATYREFAAVFGERVAAHAPEWTDHNDSDPGITLIELFAFLTESLLFRRNMIPERGRSIAVRLAQSASALAAASAGTASGALERPRYFPGRLIGVDDLQLEQDYVRARLRRLNRVLHGSGIVRGLDVSVEGDGPEQRVAVEPGFALAPTGEEIEVSVVATACLPPAGYLLHVILLYTERPTHPQAEPDGQDVEFSRIEEGFAILLAATPPTDGIVLARVLRADDGWCLDEAFAPKRVGDRRA
jgi:hypothetical protein